MVMMAKMMTMVIVMVMMVTMVMMMTKQFLLEVAMWHFFAFFVFSVLSIPFVFFCLLGFEVLVLCFVFFWCALFVGVDDALLMAWAVIGLLP